MTILDPNRTTLSRRDWFLLTSVTFIIVAISYVLFKALVPETVLTVNVHPLPVKVLNQNTIAGRAIEYTLDYCKAVDSPSTVVRELRSMNNASIVSLYTSGYTLPRGCDSVAIVEPMPAYVPAGLYVLRITFTYRTNAITSPYTFITEPFVLE